MEARHAVRVYFEDTDFSGRVYHGAFVRFLERGRTEFLRTGGLDHRALAAAEPATFFTLAALDLSFRGAAYIDDVLTVVTSPKGPMRAAAVLHQSIVRDERVIVRALARLCLIDRDGRPVRPPAAVRAVFGRAG